jgi:RNA polymerase-binding transcription factor DksA
MDKAKLARELLQSKYQELNNRLERIQLDIQRANQPLSPDFEEQAVERENDAVLNRLATVTLSEIAQVRHALDQIERGHYGVCARCGHTIGDARLKALPEATVCATCASALPLPQRATNQRLQ